LLRVRPLSHSKTGRITMRKLLTFLIALAVTVGAALAPLPAAHSAGFLLLVKPGGGGSLTYTVTDVSKAWQTGTSFTSVNIGTVAADRIIVVSLLSDSNTTTNGRPSSVTVGGVSMTSATTTLGEGASGQDNYIYYLLAPAGVLNTSSATITITTPFSLDFAIAVGNINGSAAASVSSTGGDAFSQHADPRGVPNDFTALTIPTGGVGVISGLIDRSTTMVATSANTTVDLNNPSSIGSTFTHMAAHGTNGSPTFTGANNFNASFVMAVFQP
jgi:hypothetical protein